MDGSETRQYDQDLKYLADFASMEGSETRQCDQDLKDFSSRLTLAFANMRIMVSVLAGHGPGLGVPVVLE